MSNLGSWFSVLSARGIVRIVTVTHQTEEIALQMLSVHLTEVKLTLVGVHTYSSPHGLKKTSKQTISYGCYKMSTVQYEFSIYLKLCIKCV